MTKSKTLTFTVSLDKVAVSQDTESETSRAFGWRIHFHCSVEVTESSTNKQHTLSPSKTNYCWAAARAKRANAGRDLPVRMRSPSWISQFCSHKGATSSLNILLPILSTVAIGLGKLNQMIMTGGTREECLGVELYGLEGDDGITLKFAEVRAIDVVHITEVGVVPLFRSERGSSTMVWPSPPG